MTIQVREQIDVEIKGKPVTLRAGLRCRPVTPYPTQDRPQFWLDEFPADLFPANSILRHDAEHYGIVLEADQVTES